MPSHAAANPAIQQRHINGPYCYAYKFDIITNELGIVRDIIFHSKDFLKSHPDITIEKKSASLDEAKSLADFKALHPVLRDFFQKYPLIILKTFLSNATFNSIEIHKYLLQETFYKKDTFLRKTSSKSRALIIP